MAKKEANFDLYIYELLKDVGINADTQGSNFKDIDKALKTASKKQNGNQGFPEFVAVIKDYVLVIEDKPDRALHCVKEDDKEISQSVSATEYFAINGAVFYAKKIIEGTNYKKIFAVGCSGDKKHHIIQPVFVSETEIKELPEIETFENFNEENIDAYYRRMILGELPLEEIELDDILNKARELHEYLRNYGGLGEDEKPLVVSAILLALREQKHGFSLDSLTGDDLLGQTDGDKLYNQLNANIQRANVAPETKKERIMHQFTLIKDRPQLNKVHPDLGKTPLKFYAEYINKNIFKQISSSVSPEDYLGRFYGEFVSYSGGDGQSLGVVLTPSHITSLFCDLVDLKPNDVILDPCCGTGGFLVAGMHYMLKNAKSQEEKRHIRQKQLYGIEIRDDMFAIATTNMILRGDGQSNLICDDFLRQDVSNMQLKQATVGLMNPPYSQAKNKDTANLSELSFIRQLLNSLTEGARCAVIIPRSTMIGKTKEDKKIKEEILKNHTLVGVINLNKDTFYRVGTVPCAAIFIAGQAHPKEKLVKFINYEDDGFEVRKHTGLTETERSKDRKAYLLDCWFDRISEVPSKFMVKTTIEAEDEWLHSFYYYNDELPKNKDFEKTIADYLTFEFNMITHDREYLFKED